jgi:[protein-PII] uridylyltransferase
LVVEARERLAEGRRRIRERHDKGSPGIQVCHALTELVDGIVLDVYRAAVADIEAGGLRGLEEAATLVAHGGTGRQDLAPYSDVDLMLLHAPGKEQLVAKLAERMMRDLFDVGLQLGQSVRTPQQACQSARGDATICTSLIESRRLAGSEELFEGYLHRYKKQMMQRADALVPMVEKARGEERAQYGETVYLLEPNVKRSGGGLRDIQFIRWIGFLQYGAADPDALRLAGRLTETDFQAVREAWEFLLHLRNEMHFHAGKSHDLLDKQEQLRLAKRFGYQGRAGQSPVEEFMQHYFRLTSRVSMLATRFAAATRDKPLWLRLVTPLVAHRFERDYRVAPNFIGVHRRGLPKLERDLAEILRLCELSQLYDKPIERETVDVIRRGAANLPDEVSREAAARFRAMLSVPTRLGESLRMLHETGVLEKILPDFSHARCLLQFNEYHKFTVDEHTLRAVEYAANLAADEGTLGEAYRGLKTKWLLHLALLLHDLGKGYPEDHSVVGLRIAEQMIPRLHIETDDGEALKFLVHKHLMMSYLAFRGDTGDDKTIVRFCVDVGSPEVLQMLYVLTACDIAAVGPGTFNAWKSELLTDLYLRSRERLTSDDPEGSRRAAIDERRRLVREALAEQAGDDWYERQVAGLPRGYLMTQTPDRIADDLRRLRGLGRRQAIAQGRYLPESNTVEYQVGTYEDVVPGVFHRLTGALSAQGLQILSAEINTLDDGLIIDRFWVQDPDYKDEPPESRMEEVCKALTTSLEKPTVGRPKFRRTWSSDAQQRVANLSQLPTRVRTDNNTSDKYTVLEVFAADRRGLLYTITSTLFELELSVRVAKIGTYLDQVVDVFYVTDKKGKKIDSTARLNEYRTRILVEIEALERREREQGKAW